MKLHRLFLPAGAALLFAQAALAAFPYSSSGGTSSTSLRCSNNPCKTCTSNANCGTGYICRSTSYVPPYCMNGYSTVIFDDSDPRLGPLVVDFVPDPANDTLGEVRITGALVAQYSEDPGYKAVYRVKGTLTSDINDDPAGLKGIRYQGVTKTFVEPRAPVPVCSDESCEQARVAYSVVLESGSDLTKVLTGKLVYDHELTVALFGQPASESPFFSCYPETTPSANYCEILVGVGPDEIKSTCAQAFPPVDSPFGFSVGACEILRLEEKCVTFKLEALGLVNDPVFGSRENFEACDGFGVVARMCNDAQSPGTPNCFGTGTPGNEPRGELSAFVGDETKAQEPAQEVTLVYVGPTLQNLIDALRPYGVVNGQTENPDTVGDPIFLVSATSSQSQMLLPSVVSPTELRFTPAEAGGTVITGLNITGWGQGDRAATEPLLIESPDTKNVVWDFRGMGLVVKQLVMGSGSGTVYGSTAPDVVLAGNGVDTIYGNEEGDCLDGQQNDDRIWGGPGADVFVLSGSFGRDTIYDFNAADGDVIVNITGKPDSYACTAVKCTVKVSGAGTVTVNLAEGGTGPSSIRPNLTGLPQCQGHPAY